MAGNTRLEGKNALVALKMLKEITGALDKHKVSYWLEGGTLLGIVREGRLLPWDNDMDLSITEEELPKLIEVMDKISYRVRYREFEKDDKPFQKGQVRLIKLRNTKCFFFKGDVVLEIFVKYKKDNQYFWQVGQKKKSVPFKFYEELIEYQFEKKSYLVPKFYEDYLTYRYGDWRTPVKEWNTFFDDKAIKADI